MQSTLTKPGWLHRFFNSMNLHARPSRLAAPIPRLKGSLIRNLCCLQVANIVANNASLVLISLSLNQIIRSGIPIVTAILGIVIEHIVSNPLPLSSPLDASGC